MLARVSHTHYKLPRATESWMAVSEQGYGYRQPRMSHSVAQRQVEKEHKQVAATS